MPVLSDELWNEVHEKLTTVGQIAEAEVADRYRDVTSRAIWVQPVEELTEHRRFVADDPDDTVLPRMAEAVYAAHPEHTASEHKYIVSLNTRHLRPGANWAGFLCVTPHELMSRLTEEG